MKKTALALALLTATSGHISSAVAASQSQPNIIYILVDDMGYGDAGFNGQEKIRTPILDRMAAEGIVLDQHYAGASVCGPSGQR